MKNANVLVGPEVLAEGTALTRFQLTSRNTSVGEAELYPSRVDAVDHRAPTAFDGRAGGERHVALECDLLGARLVWVQAYEQTGAWD